MKRFIVLIACCFLIGKANAQKDSTGFHIISKAETDAFFSASFKKKNLINYPIFRAYTYTDKSGNYYVALTESADTTNTEKDTVNFTIKAFNFKADQSPIVKKWEINDFRLPNVKNEVKETSIWFWTKYCSFTDLDGDGLADPVIVYGTFGHDGYSDGRVKILTFYKGQKVAIRHQNSTLDPMRKMQVDATFYALPKKIQDHTKQLMATMMEKKHALFPSSYLEKMEKKIALIN
ncbi:MAG: hypothetical protein REI78_12200 [Pedobacter sp.]|nr:hypothetical protein [Pedobacter sp.]MDQ8053785.1 hypothetical protein [Pedobacter sp.]